MLYKLLHGRNVFLYQIVWITLYIGYSECLTEIDLIPFNNGTDDKLISANDDNTYVVDLQTDFVFLNVTYLRNIHVSTILLHCICSHFKTSKGKNTYFYYTICIYYLIC